MSEKTPAKKLPIYNNKFFTAYDIKVQKVRFSISYNEVNITLSTNNPDIQN